MSYRGTTPQFYGCEWKDAHVLVGPDTHYLTQHFLNYESGVGTHNGSRSMSRDTLETVNGEPVKRSAILQCSELF